MVKIMNIVSAVSWTDIQTEVIITSMICNQGKNKELTVPRVLLWSTFFVRTEMLPVERVVADWERPANLG